MDIEAIELICEKIATVFNTTVEVVQQYLPEFLHKYGLYLAFDSWTTYFLISNILAVFMAGMFLAVWIKFDDKYKMPPAKYIVGIFIIINIIGIIGILPNFLFPEFYAIKVLFNL